jgi:Zn ribbon nucleic-acid-binding protein
MRAANIRNFDSIKEPIKCVNYYITTNLYNIVIVETIITETEKYYTTITPLPKKEPSKSISDRKREIRLQLERFIRNKTEAIARVATVPIYINNIKQNPGKKITKDSNENVMYIDETIAIPLEGFDDTYITFMKTLCFTGERKDANKTGFDYYLSLVQRNEMILYLAYPKNGYMQSEYTTIKRNPETETTDEAFGRNLIREDELYMKLFQSHYGSLSNPVDSVEIVIIPPNEEKIKPIISDDKFCLSTAKALLTFYTMLKDPKYNKAISNTVKNFVAENKNAICKIKDKLQIDVDDSIKVIRKLNETYAITLFDKELTESNNYLPIYRNISDGKTIIPIVNRSSISSKIMLFGTRLFTKLNYIVQEINGHKLIFTDTLIREETMVVYNVLIETSNNAKVLVVDGKTYPIIIDKDLSMSMIADIYGKERAEFSFNPFDSKNVVVFVYDVINNPHVTLECSTSTGIIIPDTKKETIDKLVSTLLDKKNVDYSTDILSCVYLMNNEKASFVKITDKHKENLLSIINLESYTRSLTKRNPRYLFTKLLDIIDKTNESTMDWMEI